MNTIRNILIAEDELLVAKVLKMTLERRNFQVQHVTEELAVVAAASEFKPDLIILDVYLKNKSSGINASKAIRANGIVCPIIFTTGNSFEQTREEIKNISNSHLFIKPVDVDQLIRYIEEKL